MLNVYDRIDLILKERGISRRKLAELSGIPYSTIASSFARKNKNLKIETLDKIAAALDVSVIRLNPNITWDEHKNTEELKRIERESDAFNGVVAALRDIYGAVEVKEVCLTGKGEIPYWVIGKEDRRFILFEENIQALCDSVKGLIPPLAEQLKDIRTENEIVKELTSMLNDLGKGNTLDASPKYTDKDVVYRIARSSDHAPPQVIADAKERIERFENAPRVTDPKDL